MSDNIVPVVVSVVIVAVALFLGIVVIDTIAETNPENIEVELRDDAVLLKEAGTFVDVIATDGLGTDETVVNSRGYALAFTGAPDSYLASDANIEFWTDDHWTVSQGVWIDESATNTEMVFLAIGDPDVMLRYVPDDGGLWQVVVIENQGQDSYQANVSASDPTNETIVQVVRDGDTVTIYEGNVAGDSADLSEPDSISGTLTGAENFHGTLDETRVFDVALDAQARQTLVDEPVSAVSGETVRLMYDEGDGDEVYVFWADATATVSNASFVDGFPGEKMERSGMLITRDYDWEDRGPRLLAEEGGELDGQPVAYVTHTFEPFGLVGSYVAALSNAFGLAAILPIIMIAGLIIAVLRLRGLQ